MNKENQLKILLLVTTYSILVFFSISFLTILAQISPFHYFKNSVSYKLYIGFPYKFYEQFWLKGSNFPNSQWTINNLFYDCLFTWLVVVGFLYLRKK